MAFAAIWGGAWSGDSVAQSAETAVEITDVQVGFQGLTKIGRWTRVAATVSGESGEELVLVALAADPEGHTVEYPSAPFRIEAGETIRPYSLFRFGRESTGLRLQVEVVESGEILATSVVSTGEDSGEDSGDKFETPLRQNHFICLTVGAPPGFSGLNDPDRLAGFLRDDRPVHVLELPALAELPENDLAYDAIDQLVIASDFSLTTKQAEAVERWVHRGGRLIVIAGETFQAFRDSPLAGTVPVEFGDEQFSVRELTALEAAVGGQSRLAINRAMRVPDMKIIDGVAIVPGPDRPIVIQAPAGAGTVTLSGLDFDKEPVRSWESLPRFCAVLSDLVRSSEETLDSGSRKRLSHTGITDLSTQLMAAQESFDGVERTSSWSVMAMLIGLLIVLGPIDYFVVNKILKKSQLAWVTFPLIVVVVSVAAISMARTNNGSELQLNTTELIDISGYENEVRVHGWHTVYSPESSRMKMEAQSLLEESLEASQFAAESPTLGWNGASETTFGGMYRVGGFDFGKSNYRISADHSTLLNIPIAIWSTRSLKTTQRASSPKPLIESKLGALATGQLTGVFKHNLPVPVTQWVIIYGTRAYRPKGELVPGLSYPSRGWEQISQREIRGFLTESVTQEVVPESNVGTEYRTTQKEYNPLDQDLGKILQMVTFYEAAGGRNYTGLNDDQLDRLDLSELVKLDRAILLGRVNLPASTLKIDDQTMEPKSRTTFVRMILPVDQSDRGGVDFLEMEGVRP